LIVGLAGVNEYSAIEIMVSPALHPPAGRVEEAWPDAGRTTSRASKAANENPLPIPIGATLLRSLTISKY
jgi:hypothetical protein